MNTIKLYGALAAEYGPERLYAVRSATEAVKALSVNLPGFSDRLSAMNVRVFWTKGHDPEAVERLDLDETLLSVCAENAVLHIMPALEGAGNNGIGKVLAGIALVAATIVTAGAAAPAGAALFGAGGALAGTAFLGVSYGTLALFGVGIALGGLAQMFAPKPVAPGANDLEDQRASFQINNLGNVAQQGHGIPVAYGLCMCGSVTVLGALQIEQILVNTNDTYDVYGPANGGGGGGTRWAPVPVTVAGGGIGVPGVVDGYVLVFDPVTIYTGIDPEFIAGQVD